jgi:hypothetical protein
MKNNPQKDIVSRLESQDIVLWVDEVCSAYYAAVSKIDRNETYYAGGNIRSIVQHLLLSCSRAIADDMHQFAYNEWCDVKKQAFALKNAGRFYTKQEIIPIEKRVFELLDKIIIKADKKIAEEENNWEKLQHKEIKNFQKKYDLWKKASTEEIKNIKLRAVI